ncbi:MAG: sigma-70 family RNA polymerase sigma factor [bacterium]|nr:sigma-70 family RNA polymerase sigma factor [bacterium]
MPISDQDDFDLIRNYQRGVEQAFTDLFLKYYPLVYKIFIMKGIPQAEAEDLTTEIFIKLIEALKTYRFEKPFQHYLKRVVRNRIFDYYRQKKLEWLPLDLQQRIPIPINEADQFDLEQIIDHCLQKIKSLIRRAIILSWLEGYKRRQIAELLNLPIGSVHSNLERGKSQFRNCIQENLQ